MSKYYDEVPLPIRRIKTIYGVQSMGSESLIYKRFGTLF